MQYDVSLTGRASVVVEAADHVEAVELALAQVRQSTDIESDKLVSWEFLTGSDCVQTLAREV